ncbi:MAG: hypothetical protein ABI743_08305 [bacterium]
MKLQLTIAAPLLALLLMAPAQAALNAYTLASVTTSVDTTLTVVLDKLFPLRDKDKGPVRMLKAVTETLDQANGECSTKETADSQCLIDALLSLESLDADGDGTPELVRYVAEQKNISAKLARKYLRGMAVVQGNGNANRDHAAAELLEGILIGLLGDLEAIDAPVEATATLAEAITACHELTHVVQQREGGKN